jgi:hypothetical protein
LPRRMLPILSNTDAKKILKDLCKDHGVSMTLLVQMIDIQRDNLGRGRQNGITHDFSAAIADFLEAEENS